jgi:hypothetical protein
VGLRATALRESSLRSRRVSDSQRTASAVTSTMQPAASTGQAPTPPSMVGTITAAAIAQVPSAIAMVRATANMERPVCSGDME